MATPTHRIEEHPDIATMRMPYERVAESPTTQITEGLAFLAGVYLAISPWVVGFSNLSTITINNLVIGVAVALLALGFASAFGRTHGLSWLVPVLGSWTIVSAWVGRGAGDTAAVVVDRRVARVAV